MPHMSTEQEDFLQRLNQDLTAMAEEQQLVVQKKIAEEGDQAALMDEMIRVGILIIADTVLNPPGFWTGPNIDPFEERLRVVMSSIEYMVDLPVNLWENEAKQDSTPEVVEKLKPHGEQLSSRLSEIVGQKIEALKSELLVPAPGLN